MFEFFKWRYGGAGDPVIEQRLYGTSGYAMYPGQALTVSASALIRADTGDFVYGISNTSAASSTVTAVYVPQIFPVNENQIWKVSPGSALTASMITDCRTFSNGGKKLNLNSSAATAVDGGTSGSVAWVYDIVTGSSPSTSSVYVIFVSPPAVK